MRLAFLFLLAATSVVAAGPATEFLKPKIELVRKSADDKKLDELFDFGAMAEASLQTEWAARSDAEKKELADLVGQLAKRSYRKKLKSLRDYTFEYVSEKADKSGFVMVHTPAAGKRPRDP